MASCPLATLNSLLQRQRHPPPKFTTSEIPRTYHTTLTLSSTTLDSVPPMARKALEKICKQGKKYADGPGEKAKAKRDVAEKVNEVLETFLELTWMNNNNNNDNKNDGGIVGTGGVTIKKGKRDDGKTKDLAFMSGAIPFEERKFRGKDVKMVDGDDDVGSIGGGYEDDDDRDGLGGYESGEFQVLDGTGKKKGKGKGSLIVRSGCSETSKKRNPSVVYLSDDDDSVLGGGYECGQVVVTPKKRKRSQDLDSTYISGTIGAKRKRGEDKESKAYSTKRKRSAEGEGLFVSEDESSSGDESMEGLEAAEAKATKLKAVRRKIRAKVEAAKMRKGLMKQG